jgi:hypothetical protein
MSLVELSAASDYLRPMNREKVAGLRYCEGGSGIGGIGEFLRLLRARSASDLPRARHRMFRNDRRSFRHGARWKVWSSDRFRSPSGRAHAFAHDRPDRGRAPTKICALADGLGLTIPTAEHA